MRLTALLLLASAIASAIAARAPKRGFVADGCPKGATDCMDVALLTSISWYYNYNPINSYANSPGADDSVFTPMHWCLKGLNDTIPGTVDWLMGFNEVRRMGGERGGGTPLCYAALVLCWACLLTPLRPSSSQTTNITATSLLPSLRARGRR